LNSTAEWRSVKKSLQISGASGSARKGVWEVASGVLLLFMMPLVCHTHFSLFNLCQSCSSILCFVTGSRLVSGYFRSSDFLAISLLLATELLVILSKDDLQGGFGSSACTRRPEADRAEREEEPGLFPTSQGLKN